MIKIIKYSIELFFFLIFFSLFYILPLKFARKFSSMLASKVGKFTSTNRVILNNLRIAFPKESEEWIAKINHDVWINFGKVVAEYAHLNELSKNNKIKIIENIHSNSFFDKSNNKILISAHNANWEVPGIACRSRSDKISGIVREPNNPFIRFILSYLRDKYSVRCYQKNLIGTKKLMQDYRNGFSIALLADQKLTSGIKSKFYGKEVLTTSLPAQIALKSKSDIYLAWPKRIGDNFEFEFFEPISSSKLEDNEINKLKIIEQINIFFENRISENPAEYFWHHNRWK